MDDWCEENGADAFAQIGDVGSMGYVPKNMEWERFLGADEWDQKFSAAQVVVSHAGMGTIISALMAGKPSVIMPRQAAYQEHRNDHQIATAKRFGGRSGVHVAIDELELPRVVEAAMHQPAVDTQPLGRYADPMLIEVIRGFILAGK